MFEVSWSESISSCAASRDVDCVVAYFDSFDLLVMVRLDFGKTQCSLDLTDLYSQVKRIYVR